jgi:glycosyltransferase involved in cell wall biosynthesis
MINLSAAIIVKNEEAVMERCIKSVSQFADEIVIVDTGSTDKTKEIASKFSNVRLYDSEFFNKDTHYSEFEFGKAKNEAIRKCIGKWIIWWDADDFADENTAKNIRKIADTDEKCLYNFVISYGGSQFEHCRMFPNGLGIYFDELHACHEFLNSLGHPQRKDRTVVIQHIPLKKSVPSNKRNIAILEKDYFERERRDQRTIFYLANSYREARRNEEAIDFYGKYLKTSQWKEERLFARYYSAMSKRELNRWKDCRDELLMAIQEDDRFAEIYCLLGDIHSDKGRLEEAILWYSFAARLKVPPPDARLFVVPHYYFDYPVQRIKECKMSIENAIDVEPEPELVVEPEGCVIFNVPAERDVAVMSAFAMKGFSDINGKKKIKVVVNDEWMKKLFESVDNTIVSAIEDEGALNLDKPGDMKNKHCIEWLCRSAGFIPNDIPNVSFSSKEAVIESMNYNEEPFVVIQTDATVSDDEWSEEKWQDVSQKLSEIGFKIFKIDENSDFTDVLSRMLSAKFFIGVNGWAHHIAYSLGRPSIVLWGKSKPNNYGYESQHNIISNGSGMNGITVDDVMNRIKEFSS